MLRELDNFYFEQPEPNRGYFLALREFITDFDEKISEEWKYKAPFFYYKNKPFCYLWKHAKTQQPYIGIVKAHHFEHPMLTQGNRKKMKVLYLNPKIDIPIKMIETIFQLAINHY